MLRTKILLIFAGFLAAFTLMPLRALADPPPSPPPPNAQDQIQCGVNAAAGSSDCTPPKEDAGKTISDKIDTIVNLLSTLVGVVAVIMIMVGGFRYITSGGSSDKVSGAKSTILYAVIGLVIVASAQLIAHFVIAKAK